MSDLDATPARPSPPPFPTLPSPDAVIAPIGPSDDPSATPVAGIGDRRDDAAAPPRPLIAHIWLRVVMIVTNLAAVPAALIVVSAMDEPELTVPSANTVLAIVTLPVIGFAALVAWSGVASANAGRARPRNRREKRPTVPTTVLAWFAPALLVAVVASGWSVLDRVDGGGRTSLDPRDVDGDGATAVRALLMIALVLAVILATYRPYAVLRRISRCVAGEHTRFRNWFIAPFAGALVGAGLVAFSRFASQADDGIVAAWFGAVTFVVAISLPWIFWLIVGNRAMENLESAIVFAHHRAVQVSRLASSETDPDD